MTNFDIQANAVTQISQQEEERGCLVVGKAATMLVEREEEENQKRNFHLSPRKGYPSSSLPVKKRCREPLDNHNGASTFSSTINLCCFDSFGNSAVESAYPSSCISDNRLNVEQDKRKGGQKIASNPSVKRKVPNWVFQVMRNINGDVENPRMLLERTLTESDVKSSQSRLLIPFSKVITKDFLTLDEARAMNKEENKQEDENVGVGTIVVNENSQMWGLRLKIWQMEKKNSGKGTLNYALNWGWNDVVEGNRLKANDKIGLWVFRCRGVLCFALDMLERVNSISSNSSGVHSFGLEQLV